MQLYVARAGKELGSFWMDEVREKLKSGEFKSTDHGWMEGRGDWKLLTEFPELASAIPQPAKSAEAPPPAEPAPKTSVTETAVEQPAKSSGKAGRSKKTAPFQPVSPQPTEPGDAIEPAPHAPALESTVVRSVEIPAAAAPTPEPSADRSTEGKAAEPDEETASAPKVSVADSPSKDPAETPAATTPEPAASIAEAPPEPLAEAMRSPEPEAAPQVPNSSTEEHAEPDSMVSAAGEETASAPPPEFVLPAVNEPEPEPERIFLRARPAEPEVLPEAPHPVTVPGPVPTSAAAIASVIFGILSLTVLPFVGAICALIFGHLARRRIAEARGALDGSSIARTGLTLGYWGFFLSLFAIVAGLAWFISTHHSPRSAVMVSIANAKQIANACEAYAVDHEGKFPEALTDLTPKYLPNPATLICPLSGPSVPIGYEYYGGRDTDPPSRILLVSKARQRNRRVVAYVDTSVRAVGNMSELPPHER